MSWRLRRPRRLSTYEAQIIRRVLEIGACRPVPQALLDSIDHLLVLEEGDGGFLHDSLDFAVGYGNDKQIAHALGLMANDAPVEVSLRTREGAISYLSLDPWDGSLRPTRMPRLESIRAFIATDFGTEDEEETMSD
jgi:hypothetical protein